MKILTQLFVSILLVLLFNTLLIKVPLAQAQYTLEPSEKVVNTHVHFYYESYGVNVLLKKDGQLVIDQNNINYTWVVNDPSVISLKDSGFSSSCPYNLVAPCPNMHADITGLKEGSTNVEVKAFSKGSQIASTTFTINIDDSYYLLEPTETSVVIPVGGGYGVNVLLKGKDPNGNRFLILDQNGIRYEWLITDNSVISLEDNSFYSGCPYNLTNPCPNLHSTIWGLKPGSTAVNVKAYLLNTVIAETNYAVRVEGSSSYTLDPSEKSVTTYTHLYYEGYGLNVSLKKDGQLVMDQRDIKYQWKVTNPKVISLTDSGFSTGCPYNINNPCPNLHAEFKALNEGSTEVQVMAFKDNAHIASTAFIIEVNNSSYYSLEPNETLIKMPISTEKTGYGVNVLLKGKSPNGSSFTILDQKGIQYKWTVADENFISLVSSGFASGCPYNLVAPCPNMHADLKGLKVGLTAVEVVAYLNESPLAKTNFMVQVSELGSSQNNEGPKINEELAKQQQEVNKLKEKVGEMTKEIEVQKRVAEENKSLLIKIVNFLKRLFGFSTS